MSELGAELWADNMSDDRGVKTENEVYQKVKTAMKLTRDAVDGVSVIKSDENKYIYLPHPNPHEKNTPEGREQYKRYLCKAEYDNVPQFTLNALVGSMFRKEAEIELPSNLQYIEDDSDGDGTTLKEALQITAAELLMMHYYGLLAEYSDLAGIDPAELTVADAQAIGANAYVKHYPRESIINWGWRNSGGKKKLSFVVLKEAEFLRKDGSYNQIKVSSYLVLALDENGEYFQEKYIEKDDEYGEWSEPLYPLANGRRLDYIPFELVSATKEQAGTVSCRLGHAHPIAEKAIARYQVSADMKESMWYSSAPITTSSGWTEQALAMYKEATGRDHIGAGPGMHIPLPEGGQLDIKSWSLRDSAFLAYMENNAAEIRAAGGVFDTTEGAEQETATAAAIKAAEKSGILSSIASNIEESWVKLLNYCQEFNGSTDGDIEIKLSREFSSAMIDPQMIAALINAWNNQLMTTADVQKELRKGGLSIESIESVMGLNQNDPDMP